MILYIDLGNTRLKWAIDNENKPAILWQDPRQIERLLFQWQSLNIAQVYWLSSANDAINQTLIDFFEKNVLSVKRFTSLYKFKKIKTAYSNQKQLGDDRWLAVVASYPKLKQPYCVISAGTAITVDFVYKNQHYPSIIIPGERLMREALQQKTSNVNTAIELLMSTPKNTQQCVQLGIQTSISSAIEQIIKYYQLLFNLPINTVITGGDATWLQQQLTTSTTVNKTLIIEGLKSVYP